ncbi:MAG: GDYXXLXY domain-containing protein [Candidatus Omnitrophota bacterium]
MNKKIILFSIIFLWIAIAAVMVISKQHTLKTGRIAVLETVPVDPRDFLRGDYVTLRYKINRLYLNQLNSEKAFYNSGEVIYVKLEPKGKFYEAVAVQTKKSIDNGLYIRGRIRYNYGKSAEVTYGIESYFVAEGEGQDIERSMRGSKSSVSVEVVIDSSGAAMIKKVYAENPGI